MRAAQDEQVLKQHPAVEEACVVGLEEAEWGQRVAVAIILKPGFSPTEEEILAFSRQRLAGYKQPRLIRFVAALPQTASGKIIREKVRELIRNSSGSEGISLGEESLP